MAAKKDIKLPSFAQLNNISSALNGAEILFASDDFFGVAENLIKDEEPVWKEGEYTEFGKWMDGWETRRKRIPGHDFCIIQLAAPAVIKGIEINTAFFTGNHAPKISIQAFKGEVFLHERKSILGDAARTDCLNLSQNISQNWKEIVPKSTLQPGYDGICQNWFRVDNEEIFTHIRLNMFPDGGIARIRVYGHVRRLQRTLQLHPDSLTDLIAFENGGECIDFSNAHFGHPRNLIRPGMSQSMADGWETARRLDRSDILITAKEDGRLNYTGSEWCVIKMGVEGIIHEIKVYTTHFKGNYPHYISIEGGILKNEETEWRQILSSQKLNGDEEHNFPVNCSGIYFTHIRVTIVPDGGISRLHVLGKPENSFFFFR